MSDRPPRKHRSSRPEPSTMTYRWAPCPEHPTIAPSVILTHDAPAWCIGLPDVIRGHAVEWERAA